MLALIFVQYADLFTLIEQFSKSNLSHYLWQKHLHCMKGAQELQVTVTITRSDSMRDCNSQQ